LREKAQEAARTRRTLITASTSAIVKVSDGSLELVLEAKRVRAKTWLATQGVHLSSGSRSSGYRNTESGMSARNAGRGDGARAQFTAKRVAKLTTGGAA
jgi:hypothetical protein